MSMFINRINKNYSHLRKWAKREGHTAFRIYDKDIPEFPVAVDFYDHSLVVYEYVKAHHKDDPEKDLDLHALSQELADFFKIDPAQVFLKSRQRQKGLSQYEKLSAQSETKVVTESGLKFLVNLTDYLDTGLFLDHRSTRMLIQKIVEGKTVLNLFSYTGSVSVHAAAGKAKTITSVDMSNTYTEWAKENFRLNDFEVGKHVFVREDVLKFLSESQGRKNKFDFIFVDPPSFSNSKKMESEFDVQRDHVDLLKSCLGLLADDGTILFSTNLRSFKLDIDAFASLALENITKKTIPPDFRNEKIHQAWLMKRKL